MVITFGNLYSDRSILISVFLEYINYAITAAEPDKIRMDLLLKAMKVRLALSCVNPSVCLPVPCLYFVIVCSIFCLLLDWLSFFFISLSICLIACLSVCLSVSVFLSICLSVCPSVCLYVCQSVCLSVRPSVCLFVSLFVCLSVWLSSCLSVCLSVCVCLPVCLLVCLSFRLSVCLFVCHSVWLSTCLSICLSFCLTVHLPVCLSGYPSFSQPLFKLICHLLKCKRIIFSHRPWSTFSNSLFSQEFCS